MRRTLSIFEPGVRLMRRLRIPVKMAVMGVLLLIPLTMLLGTMVKTAQADIDFASGEIEGARLVGRIATLVTHAQTHRGLTSRAQQTDVKAVEALPKVREAFAQAYRALDAEVLNTRRFELADLWAPLSATLQELSAGRHPSNRKEAFAQHSQAIEALRQMLLLAAERSGLLLDPQATTFFLMDICVERTPSIAEMLGITRGAGAAILFRGEISNTERVQLLGRMDALELKLTDLQGKINALQRSGMAPPPSWAKALQASSVFTAHVRTTLGADVLDADPSMYFERGTQALAALGAFNNDVVATLEAALGERRSALRNAMVWQVGAAVASIGLVIYLGIAFYLSFRGAFRALLFGVGAVSGGNLEHKVDVRGRDELAEMGQTLEAMNARLSAMVADIRSNAARVGQAGQQVAAGTESLSQRTEEQATSLRQTVATVGHLSAAVASNAAAAQELDGMAGQLRLQAEAGGQAMHATVASMSTLQSSSKRVGEIIGVIDGIAFQTNILALNAAVEAARAGEAGRGFAVVASEVRMLAQRSSAAAAEIRKLIGQSGEQVAASVSRIQGVSATLGAVVAGVQDVSQRLRGIAAASAEQSVGLREMSANVGNLDKITQQNASMVEESSLASQELVERAGMLHEAVASIRLRQGTADEAHALVERAMQLIAATGSGRALAHMRNPSQGFVDRDLYVFVVDRRGAYQLHAAKPAMEGKRVHDVPGINGDQFVHDAWACTENGPAWIEYDILNPGTGTVQPKASYMARIDEHLVLGCGVYRRSQQALGSGALVPAPAMAAAPERAGSALVLAPSAPVVRRIRPAAAA